MVQAFQGNVRHYLYRWKDNADLKTDKQSGAESILKRLRRRILRLGFNKYKRGVYFVRQDRLNAKRVLEVKARLAYRVKRRIYNAIRTYSGNHHNATAYLRSLIQHRNHTTAQRAFRRWRDVN